MRTFVRSSKPNDDRRRHSSQAYLAADPIGCRVLRSLLYEVCYSELYSRRNAITSIENWPTSYTYTYLVHIYDSS